MLEEILQPSKLSLNKVEGLNFLSQAICDPPCVNGACVGNNTCFCSEGYEGTACNEPGTILSLYEMVLILMQFCMNVM